MSTAIMHSTSLYEFGEFPRKNQTNSSRSSSSNTQMVAGGGGGGGGNTGTNHVLSGSAAAAAIGAASGGGSTLLSQSFNVAAAVMVASNNSNATVGGLNSGAGNGGDRVTAHKQQHSGGLGTHSALHRSVSQPSTFTMDNIFELLKLAEAHTTTVNAAMANANALTTVTGGSCSSSISSTSSSNSSSSSSSTSSGNNKHAPQNTSSSSGHRKLERTQSEPLPQQVNTSRYKTELCRPYEEAGECKYGDKCQFAHGLHELRNLQRHPKYKTELCRTFHSVGFCPYGPRCHFVHNAEEARNHNRNVAAYHARMAAAAAAAAATTASKGGQQQQQQQQPGQQHATGGLSSVSVAQLQTAAALLAHPSLAAAHQQLNHHHQQHHHHHSQHHHQQHHQLPLSPALSMSTGSDRASPIGSLSLSPTTSMASFFPEAGSPTFPHQTVAAAHQPAVGAFNFPASPPASPIDGGLSPMATPPPSSPSLLVSSMKLSGLEERLPVFNRLSSAVDAFTNLAL
ncbi:protein TIS11 [Anopheles bellator]|uniref:protein TIS11 n=1 Tax=Anopheles bellator TaxID=139047 RepID=UPI002648FF2F|nr:protein TIS11 [Anopheles bellator]